MRSLMLFAFALCLSPVFAAFAEAKDVEYEVVACKAIDTGLDGSVAGAAPPALVTIESAEEAEKISRAILKACPESKPSLREALGEYREMDFDSYAYVGIFTRPIDNYSIDVKSVGCDKDVMTIRFSYAWERRQYFRAPDLSIYFAVIRIPKTGAAVVADYGTESVPMILKPTAIQSVLPPSEDAQKEFDVAAEGTIELNEAAERAGEGPFLYVLKSAEDVEKLDAKMKTNFAKAAKGVAEIMKDGFEPDFAGRIYLLIFSAPCASADMAAKGVEHNDERAETLVSVDYARVPAAEKEKARLAYLIVSLPKRESDVMLAVRQSGGARRVRASALEAARTDAQTRQEYEIRRDSADYAVADTLAQLGEWCVKNGLYDEGRRHLQSALRYNALNVRAARALRELDVLASLEKQPSTPEEYARRALIYKGLGRFDAAKKDIDEALKMDPGCAEAHFASGMCDLLMREFPRAVESLDRAIAADPAQAEYFAARAQCRALLGQFDEAEKDAAVAFSLGKNAAAFGARGVIFLLRSSLVTDAAEARKLVEQARDQWAKAVEIDPQSAEARAGRGLAFLKLYAIEKKPEYLENAFEDCVRSLQLNPYQYDAHLHLASYHVYCQDVLAAESSLNRAVSGFPQISYVYEQRGLFYLALGNNEAAARDFEKCIELRPAEASGYFNRARAKSGQSKLIDALRDFDKAVELDPSNPRYYWERGMFHYNTSNLESALRDFKKTLEIGVSNASACYMLGMVHFGMENYAEAEASLKKCLQMKPDDEMLKSLYHKLGLAQMKLERYKDAVESLEKCLAMKPDDKTREDVVKKLEEAKRQIGG